MVSVSSDLTTLIVHKALSLGETEAVERMILTRSALHRGHFANSIDPVKVFWKANMKSQKISHFVKHDGKSNSY